MSSASNAFAANIEGNLMTTISLYEESLSQGTCDAEDLIDMSVIYWLCTETGFSAFHHLDSDLIQKASLRKNDLLTIAEQLDGRTPEPEFWRIYYTFTDLGEDITEHCLEIAKNNPEFLIPSFYLVGRGLMDYVPLARRLAAQCRKYPTFKNKYILSILGSSALPKQVKQHLMNGGD